LRLSAVGNTTLTGLKFVDTLIGARPVGNVTVNTPVCVPVNVPVGIVAGAVGVNTPLLIVPDIGVPPAGVNVAGALAGRLEPVNVIVGSVEPTVPVIGVMTAEPKV
jgi:hypothetical protein